MAALEVKGLVKTFGKVTAVDDVSFTVEKNEFVSLLGPSGCGKSTILRCIAGHEKPDKGEITIGDKVVFSSEKGIMVPPHKRGLAMVFQSYALWPHMTAFDNIAYPLRESKYGKQDISKRVGEMARLLNIEGLEERFPSELSGGQQQRVALGRALAYKSHAILLDEPLSNLDAKLRERMRLELKNIKNKIGMTTIYVTHDRQEALTLSDRIFVMREGKIMGAGDPIELYTAPPNGYVAQFLGLSIGFSGRVLSKGPTDTWVVRTTDGLDVHCETFQSLSEGNQVALYVAPTDIDILEHNGKRSGTNIWEADVLNYGFTGEFVDYEVQLVKRRLHVRKFGLLKKVGEKVYVKIDPKSFRLIRLAKSRIASP